MNDDVTPESSDFFTVTRPSNETWDIVFPQNQSESSSSDQKGTQIKRDTTRQEAMIFNFLENIHSSVYV